MIFPADGCSHHSKRGCLTALVRTVGWADLGITLCFRKLFLWYDADSQGRAILLTDIHGAVWRDHFGVSQWMTAPWLCHPWDFIWWSVLLHNEQCMYECMLQGLDENVCLNIPWLYMWLSLFLLCFARTAQHLSGFFAGSLVAMPKR